MLRFRQLAYLQGKRQLNVLATLNKLVPKPTAVFVARLFTVVTITTKNYHTAAKCVGGEPEEDAVDQVMRELLGSAGLQKPDTESEEDDEEASEVNRYNISSCSTCIIQLISGHDMMIGQDIRDMS